MYKDASVFHREDTDNNVTLQGRFSGITGDPSSISSLQVFIEWLLPPPHLSSSGDRAVTSQGKILFFMKLSFKGKKAEKK